MTHAPHPPRGRLAPSPSGYIHLGNAYAFLLAWLAVRSAGGSLVLRLEDIDPARCRPEYAAGLIKDLEWLGLDWDEGPGADGPVGPYTQSLRLERYAAALEDLRRRGLTYPCFCTRGELRLLASAPHVGDEGVPYPGTCRGMGATKQQARMASGRQASNRLDVAASLETLGGGAASLRFTDLLRGPIVASPADCGGDFALRRSDGVFAYQLATAYDDAAMRITQVARGQDLLPSTPRQVLLLRLFGANPPNYLHFPLVLDHQGERLAKRHRPLEILRLRRNGVSARAVTGLLGRLAGLLPEAAPCAPDDLLPLFKIRNLADIRPVIPENIVELLRAIS